jgi:uncharacterized protein YlzI (FlbEa/FlbD family)
MTSCPRCASFGPTAIQVRARSAETATNVIILRTPAGKRFALNPDLIRRVDDSDVNVDTVVTLVDGVTYAVAESVDIVAERMLAHRIAVVTGSPEPDRRLRLVD